MKKRLLEPLFIFIILLQVSPLFAQKVYFTPSEILKLFFKDSARVEKITHPISTELKNKIEEQFHIPIRKEAYTFYVGKSDEKITGYAIIDEEIGKVAPITFITLISPQGEIEQVEIMVYRETHGGEVAHQRFLKQFQHKKLKSTFKLHQDIRNITGATLSAQALLKGTKRALALWEVFYGS